MKKTVMLSMPKLTPDMENATLCAWMKNEGEDVRKGDVLFEVETNKVVLSVESDKDGKLGRIFVEEGDDVKVGSDIAEFEPDD